MNREKQIEEMAKDLCNSTMCDLDTYNSCRRPRGNCSRCQRVAEDLYNIDYRKQEWTSVDERLPESSDIECLLYLDNGQITIGWYHVSAGAFVEGGIAVINIVTHWMPLPEAPKMKGGAE